MCKAIRSIPDEKRDTQTLVPAFKEFLNNKRDFV